MLGETKSVKELEKAAKKNDLLFKSNNKFAAWGLNESDIEKAEKQYVQKEVDIQSNIMYVKEFLFYAYLSVGGEVDEWLDNATGLASIRFCIMEDDAFESTVTVSDIFQEEMVINFKIEEVLKDIFGLKIGDIEDIDDTEIIEFIEGLKPADLMWLYYKAAKIHWEE